MMQDKRILGIALAKLLIMGCLALISFSLLGQSVRGSLAGTVSDTTGAVISNAKIVVTNTETGVSLATTSTSTGSYAVPEMPLGVYNLRVTANGFRVGAYNGIHITVNSATVQNVQLTPGEVTQTVTVRADALTLQTASSDINGTISSQEIAQLPLGLGGMKALRSPQSFTFLQPGTVGPGTATSSNGPSGVDLFKVDGGQEFGMETIYDGLSQDRALNGSGAFDEEAPSVDALREFKLTISNPPAEFGRTTGGVESFSTKSGTNAYHGGLYDIFKNNDLDANTWFNNGYNILNCTGQKNTPACHATYARPNDKQNDYGGTFGGYVRIPHLYNGKNRTFFFFSWEQFRQSLGATITSTVPTALERSGDFSQFLQTTNPIGTNPCDGTTVYYGEIFDPATTRTVGGVPCRTAFSGNKFSSSRFSSVASALLSYYPQPTNSNLTQNYTLASSYPVINTTYTARIDESANAKNQIFFTYSTRKNTSQTAPNQLPFPVDPNEFHQVFATHLTRFGWDAFITPHLLNHFEVGGNRINASNVSASLYAGNVDYAKQMGYSLDGVKSYSFLVTQVGEGIDNLGKSTAHENTDNSVLLSDSVSWERGRHNLKVGIDVRYFQTNAASLAAPTLTFARGETAAASLSTMIASSGNGLASMLLGEPNAAALTSVLTHYPRWTHMYYAGFAQDDIHVSSDLTLNLGVRYDVETPRREGQNQTSTFDPTALDPEYGIPGALVFGTTCTNCNTAWMSTWLKNIGPRAGFAWTPPFLQHKVVVRGGAGIMYGPLQYNDNMYGMNGGYSANPSLSSSDTFTPLFSLDDGFPAFQPPPDLDPGLFNGQPISPNYIENGPARSPVVNNWSLQVEGQVAQDTLLTVGYTGMSSSRLDSNLQNINNIPIADFALGNQLTVPVSSNTVGVQAPFSGFTTLWKGGTVQQALRPFPQYGTINSSSTFQDLGHATYNALLVSLQREFHHGLGGVVSYTRSRDITNTDSLQEGNGTNAGTQIIQNPLNPKGEKALSLQDLPNILALGFIYELPFGNGHRFGNHANYLVNEIVSGWKLSGVQRYESGIPISFGCASTIPGWDNCARFSFAGAPIKSAAEQEQHLNPLLTAQGANPAINSLFNGASYGSQTAAVQTNPAFFDQNNSHFRGSGAYTFGTVPRVTGADRMNPYFNEDFSLLKSFQVRESAQFTLECEALNATNRHAWAVPDVKPNDLLFGVPTTLMNNPRQIQIIGRLTF